ncbi:MAG: hypothetical protein J7501_16185, partial [Bdellovibrio sp.]|nr:hypothetical protein [Bdellovibrio sp.]
MKKSIKLISVLLLCLGLTACTPSNKVAKRASHLELNLSSSQLQALYDEKQKSSPSDSEADIDRIIAIGKRNIQWLEILNKNLAANEDRLSFGDLVPATNDMIHPVTYSRKLIVDAYAELEQQTPQGMVAVYNSSAELPIKLTVSRKDYLKYARLTDLIYKRALRWKLLEDQLEDMAAAKIW